MSKYAVYVEGKMEDGKIFPLGFYSGELISDDLISWNFEDDIVDASQFDFGEAMQVITCLEEWDDIHSASLFNVPKYLTRELLENNFAVSVDGWNSAGEVVDFGIYAGGDNNPQYVDQIGDAYLCNYEEAEAIVAMLKQREDVTVCTIINGAGILAHEKPTFSYGTLKNREA